MRIAIAVDNNTVTDHFGHCEYFLIYDIENNEKKGSEILKNPPHKTGALPKFLKSHNVDVVITGNMGDMAKKVMKGFKIEVICGVSGSATEVIESYLNKTLKGSEGNCEKTGRHDHHNHYNRHDHYDHHDHHNHHDHHDHNH